MEKFVFAKAPPGDGARYRALQVQSEGMHFTLLARFVVTWRDTDTGFEQCLGDLSTDRHDSPPCFLALGLSVSQELLLYFHLPLKIHATSKGTRNIYLVVPAASFDMVDASTNSLELVSNPQETPALSKAGVEAGAELIHARFALQQPGFVLMTAGKAQKPVNERSRGLLLSLKSLSQARSFDLYVRNLESNADIVRKFLRAVSSGTCRSPEVDRKATFNGRPWGINAWDTYKLRDDETLSKVWNPLFDEAPPSYEATVQSPPGEPPRDDAAAGFQEEKGAASANLHEARDGSRGEDGAGDHGDLADGSEAHKTPHSKTTTTTTTASANEAHRQRRQPRQHGPPNA
ncbi:hypothetical protein SLS58_010885 [Diplodia intermedia]|uniref:Uncharacterized protein n=1 Tax=Diplodia intermedia TaxID=856260 RepID=A0ABR3T3M3_9PEZI